MAAIELREVTRRFGDFTAVDAVTLDVEEGEIVGLLGHNGAGKTTLIRVINGLLTPTAGTVRVEGLDPTVDGERVRRATGVLTEYPALEAYLSPRENLEVFADINGLPRAQARRHIEVLLERLELMERQNEPSRELSAGLKQRVALARALIHDPSLLLLDEPTTNMDPVAAREVRRLVLEAARDHGRTVLLSTHNLEEAELLCDRVAIMRDGRALQIGSPATLRRSLGAASSVRIGTAHDHLDRLTAMLPPELDHRILDADTVEVDLTGTTNGASDVPSLVSLLAGHGIPVHEVTPMEPTLEDLYVALHRDPLRAPAQHDPRVATP